MRTKEFAFIYFFLILLVVCVAGPMWADTLVDKSDRFKISEEGIKTNQDVQVYYAKIGEMNPKLNTDGTAVNNALVLYFATETAEQPVIQGTLGLPMTAEEFSDMVAGRSKVDWRERVKENFKGK